MAYTIKEEYIPINGITEYTYQAIQEGLPIAVFVHGSGTPDSLFAYKQIQDYEGVFSCIFYDQRGSGKTYAKNKTAIPTYADMQQDLLETVLYITKTYQTDKVILIANSLGTIISTPFVLKHPELVSHFIVSGFIPKMRGCEADAMQEAMARAKTLGNSSVQKSLNELKDYPSAVFTPKCTGSFRKLEEKLGMSKPISKEMRQMLTHSPIFTPSDLFTMLKSTKINEQLFRDIWDFSLLSCGSEFKVPIYFLQGEEDFVAPMTTLLRYYEQITAPVKQLVPIKNAGHITGFDNMQDYSAALLAAVRT